MITLVQVLPGVGAASIKAAGIRMRSSDFLIVFMLYVIIFLNFVFLTICKVMKFYNLMKHSLAVLLFALLWIVPARAQQPQQKLTPEEKEKKIYEYVDKETERLTDLLKLDETQQYYVTVKLTEYMQQYNAEFEALSTSGVQNTDLYQMVTDKWMDIIDKEYEKIFTPQQWKKYLKSGGERARKAREKRQAKFGTIENEAGVVVEN